MRHLDEVANITSKADRRTQVSTTAAFAGAQHPELHSTTHIGRRPDLSTHHPPVTITLLGPSEHLGPALLGPPRTRRTEPVQPRRTPTEPADSIVVRHPVRPLTANRTTPTRQNDIRTTNRPMMARTLAPAEELDRQLMQPTAHRRASCSTKCSSRIGDRISSNTAQPSTEPSTPR